MHGKTTRLLIDYNGTVVSFLTKVDGNIHDALAAIHISEFKEIIKNNLVKADPGYNGVGYIVSGFKPSQVKTWAQRVFDNISRSEQVMIENVNKFIKDARSVNKQDMFRQGPHRLLACVFISIGLYNRKKLFGYY